MITKYFHTIRHLRISQIFNRILFPLTKPFKIKKTPLPLRNLSFKFQHPINKKQSLINENTFLILNKPGCLSNLGWNDEKFVMSKLWRYNQHYFDFLNAKNQLLISKCYKSLLQSWITENPIGFGIGWEPYPTSLRIVNWIKFHYLRNNLNDDALQSLAIQSRWLNKRLEKHILGNHLFANAKALFYASNFFSGKESNNWYKKSINIISHELSEQILPDGGNFELSTMYHSIFLEDLLDLINQAMSSNKNISDNHLELWIKIAKKMLYWLETMTHPDGEISFFNDAASGIAPNLSELIAYAKRLGIKFKKTKFSRITHKKNSGYVRLISKNIVALLDVAQVGPDYQPGHGHADTLTFELSLFKERVIVNSGTSGYDDNIIRLNERSTKYHNTVEVNYENSSEVWKSFRVGRRAYPFDLKLKNKKNFAYVSCAHNGYLRLKGKPIHKRIWFLSDTSLTVKDKIEGKFESAFAFFHFHPLIKIFSNCNEKWILEMTSKKIITIKILEGEGQLINRTYAPEFGKHLQSKCLKVKLKSKKSIIKFSW